VREAALPPRSHPTRALQPSLWPVATDSADGTSNLVSTFRRLYYHLYTNSSASRAERIAEDLSLILLLKLAAETNGGGSVLHEYLHGSRPANDVLMPVLRSTFPDLVSTSQSFSLGDPALKTALHDLNQVRLTTSPAHVLGEAFQSLIGPRLRGDKGQFFTPRSLVRAMVEIVAPEPHESVLDPACGTGGFLMEAHIYQLPLAGEAGPTGRLVGVDKDIDLVRVATALLRIASQGRAAVDCFNSLDLHQWSAHNDSGPVDGYDVILTNPPFGSRIGITDKNVLSTFDFGHHWIHAGETERWSCQASVATSVDPQILFLELCIQKLKPGGRMGIVLPEGVFGNKHEGYVWDWVRDHGEIIALLDCPRTTFQPGTDTKTNVLFFRKARSAEVRHQAVNKTRIAVALQCGHDRRGRTHSVDNTPLPDDFSRLGHEFRSNSGSTSGWRQIELTHRYYLVPRYYTERRPFSQYEEDLTHGAAMMSIGELVEQKVITIRKGHEVGSEAYGTGDIPFVRTSDISNFEISTDPTKSVSEEVYTLYSKQQMLGDGDVLMVVDGRYRIGTTAIITGNNRRCVVQSHLRILSILQPGMLNPYELLFALSLPSVKLRIRDLVFVQSTLGTLGRRLLELRIPLLHGPGPWQHRVERFARVLQARDELLAEMRTMKGDEYEL